mmetsp:Transcript_143545/g.459073  ORF Transcript_143545/g.459073 Transcript_143545/m.459073 type:complete len:263 (-) Transcript_143545:41-829(-)
MRRAPTPQRPRRRETRRRRQERSRLEGQGRRWKGRPGRNARSRPLHRVAFEQRRAALGPPQELAELSVVAAAHGQPAAHDRAREAHEQGGHGLRAVRSRLGRKSSGGVDEAPFARPVGAHLRHRPGSPQHVGPLLGRLRACARVRTHAGRVGQLVPAGGRPRGDARALHLRPLPEVQPGSSETCSDRLWHLRPVYERFQGGGDGGPRAHDQPQLPAHREGTRPRFGAERFLPDVGVEGGPGNVQQRYALRARIAAGGDPLSG